MMSADKGNRECVFTKPAAISTTILIDADALVFLHGAEVSRKQLTKLSALRRAWAR